MLELLFRKEILKGVVKNAKGYARLLKDKWKMNFWATVIVIYILCMPFALLLAVCFIIEPTLFNTIAYPIFAVAFGVGGVVFFLKFEQEIWRFRNGIAINLFYRHYLIKGNALTKEDFKVIEDNNDKLHHVITRLKATGNCYFVCYELLKTLKKGEIIFLRVISTQPQVRNRTYTMHVLYVKDGWCYDTYSEKQFPLEEYLKLCKGKIYKRYSYEDLGDLTYEQFIKSEASEIKEWCDANDCYENCSKADNAKIKM